MSTRLLFSLKAAALALVIVAPLSVISSALTAAAFGQGRLPTFILAPILPGMYASPFFFKPGSGSVAWIPAALFLSLAFDFAVYVPVILAVVEARRALRRHSSGSREASI